jgi:hypothetical protein
MTRALVSAGIVALLVAACAHAPAAVPVMPAPPRVEEWSADVAPGPAEPDLQPMAASLFVPESAATVRAVVVFDSHGCTSSRTGELEYADPAWRKAAVEGGFALALVSLRARKGGDVSWAFP